MVAMEGRVRLPVRNLDRYGAEIRCPFSFSALTTSADVYGPRPGGNTTSKSRLRRSANDADIPISLCRQEFRAILVHRLLSVSDKWREEPTCML